jgi:outer membrane immunogenic protein
MASNPPRLSLDLRKSDCPSAEVQLRTTMRNSISAAVAISAIVGIGAASAADMAPRYTKAPPMVVDPAYNWSGFYLGAQVGYAWNAQDNYTREFRGVVPDGFFQPYRTEGVVGGLHGGYNWQFRQFVLGIEADGEGADIRGGYRLANASGTDFRLRDQASIRGRLGVAYNNSLFYVTGGAAFTDIQHTYVSANIVFEGISSERTGYTVGAGWEYGFAANWSARLEYRYTDFGTYRDNSLVAFPGFMYEDHPIYHTVRGGISYRFGGPVVAKY